jgi:hypothetical protein
MLRNDLGLYGIILTQIKPKLEIVTHSLITACYISS